MSKGNCTKGADGSLIYTTTAKPGEHPALDSEKWYVEKLEIAGYEPQHLTIKINADGIIRVDGNFKDEKKSRSFFKEYIIPDGVDYEALEFGIYEADKNTLVIVGAISGGGAGGQQTEAEPAPPAPVAAQQQATKTETSSTITRTEDTRVSSTFTETFESSELEGSEDISKEIRVADKKFEAKLNVSEYRTDEVHVKISRKLVLIYTSRKEVTTTSTRKEIKKTFEIPAGVRPESITGVVGKDGNLTITAPVDEELAKQQVQQQQVQQQNTSTTQTSTTTTNQTQQQQQVTTSKEVAVVEQQKQVQQQQQQATTNADEVVLRTRTVTTVKNVTGQDLQGVKIDKDRFEMNVDVREYSLQEVTIKIVKTRRVVTISAHHKSQFESRSLHREFTLPAGAPDSNPDAIDAVLSSNGILTISGPCAPQPAALTDITNALAKSTQDTSQQIQQQHQQQVVQQQQQTQTQQIQQQQQQSHQSVQKSSYTKITRKTFTSSSMTSLDVTGTDDDPEPQPEPGTPVEDVSDELAEDEDGNLILQLNVKDYRAEDIKVKVSKSTITITGRKTEEIREESKLITRIRQFCKKIRIPADVVVTPQSITSNLDTAEGVLVIMITRSTTKTNKQVTQTQQQQVESVEQQQRRQQQEQRKVESIQETQTRETQMRQQVESVQQQQQKQTESVEQVQQSIQQQHEKVESVQQQQQQKSESVVQQTTQQQIDSVQQQQQNVEQQQQRQVQQPQQQQRVDSSTQKSTTTSTTTSKRTIRTSITTTESLQKLGYNFDSATTQIYTGDPKFFERATPIVDYKPEELEVKIAAPWVIIEGKQEMSAENGWRSKQFTKMFTVPEGVKPENIKLELNEAGDVVNCTAPIG